MSDKSNRPPPGLHTYDLGKYVADQQKSRMTCVTLRIPLENILARIKDRLWVFLTETEHELTFGEATAETFDRLRSYVDRQLTTISAPALNQFQTAYRRLKDGGDEDRAHALTSCRRVLKTLADELYPPRPLRRVQMASPTSSTTPHTSTGSCNTSARRWASTRTAPSSRRP